MKNCKKGKKCQKRTGVENAAITDGESDGSNGQIQGR